MLNKTEWTILAQLLEMAADEFGNHGCNDFELPNTPENREFMERMELWNSGPNGEPMPLNVSRDGKQIYTMDSSLMYYFKYLAEQAVYL